MTNANPCTQCGGSTIPFDPGTVSAKEYFHPEKAYIIAAAEQKMRLPIVTCQRCGHGHTPLELSETDIARWYSSEEPDMDFLHSEHARRHTARAVLSRIARHLPQKGSLIDIGAGPGIFVSQAQKEGWNANGIEPATWGVKHAQDAYGISLHQGGFEALEQFPEGSFDVVTLFDVIEHVVDPNALVRSAARVTRSGGLLVLTTPRFDSALAKLMGRKWYCIFPAHIHYFTRKSLSRTLTQAGYTITEEKKHTRHLPARYLLKRVMKMLGFSAPDTGADSSVIPVNLGDEFEIYARRN